MARRCLTSIYIYDVNPFPSKGFPIDELNRLALDRVKSISALSTHLAVKGLTPEFYVLELQLEMHVNDRSF